MFKSSKTYQTPAMTPQETARLYVGGGLVVRKVDGKKPEMGKGIDRVWRYPDVIELDTGYHTVMVALDRGMSFLQPSTMLSVDAQAGHSYIIGAVLFSTRNTEKRKWRAVIVDKGKDYAGGVSPNPEYRVVPDKQNDDAPDAGEETGT